MQLLFAIEVGQPLREALNKVGLPCSEFFLSAATTAAEQVVRDKTKAPTAFYKRWVKRLDMISMHSLMIHHRMKLT